LRLRPQTETRLIRAALVTDHRALHISKRKERLEERRRDGRGGHRTVLYARRASFGI
jgi:hypothetical protein